MHNAKHPVAVLHVLHHDTHGLQIVDVLELPPHLPVSFHFLGDAIDALGPAGDFDVLVSLRRQRLSQHAQRLAHPRLPLRQPRLNQVRNTPMPRRLQVNKRQIIQLGLDTVDAQPMREWRKNVSGFQRYSVTLFRQQRIQRPHIVQAVRQFDEHDAHVLRHRDEHLAQALRLENARV